LIAPENEPSPYTFTIPFYGNPNSSNHNSPWQQNETFREEKGGNHIMRKRNTACNIPQVEKSHNNLLICADNEPKILKYLDFHSMPKIIKIQIHTIQTAHD